jgi:hypothetical protein
MNKDASLTIRLPLALKEALEQAAAADSRSVSSYCEVVLSAHLGLRHEPQRPALGAVRVRTTKPRRR